MYPPYGLLNIVEIGASREVRLVITYYVYRVGEIESDSCRQRERGRGGGGERERKGVPDERRGRRRRWYRSRRRMSREVAGEG